jgi:hypothetical protein
MAEQDIPAHSSAISGTQGASTVLHGSSPIVEISGSVELCLALCVQRLKPGPQIALREGDSSSTKPGARLKQESSYAQN